MRIAITGGTGFLGRYLIHQLLGSGYQLRCWFRPESDQSGIPSSVEWVAGKLGDAAGSRRLVEGVDAVVHAGLDWGGRRGQDDELLAFLEVNLMGSLQLMEAARQAGVACFVFISSCAVHDVILDDRPLDEAHPLWPMSLYGAHKGALEQFVHSYGFGAGWPICALRPCGIYGLAHPASASRWFDLVGQVVRGEDIATARGGKEVHARDVARAAEILLQADISAITGQAFNCYDRYVAEEEVAQIAKEISGARGTIQKLNHGPKHQIETAKLRQLGMTFGGEPLLRQTIGELVAAHQASSR